MNKYYTYAVLVCLLASAANAEKGNSPPPATSLQYPADSSRVDRWSLFSWTAVVDPDNDVVSYTLQLTPSPDFSLFDAEANLGDVEISDISRSFTILDRTILLLDGTNYLWRVIPVDTFGARAPIHEERVVQVDYTDSLTRGAISGTVLRAVDGTPIIGAGIRIGDTVLTTDLNGCFVWENPPVVPISYEVHIDADGYGAFVTTAMVGFEELTEVNASLLLDTEFVWGDVSGDQEAGTVDASEIVSWVILQTNLFSIAPTILAPLFPAGADVNGNGIVDVNDMSQILRSKIGIISTFPADTNGDGFGPESEVVPSGTPTIQCIRYLSLMPGNDVVPGEEHAIALAIDDVDQVAGFRVHLAFDPEIVSFNDISDGSATAGWVGGVNAETLGTLIFARGVLLEAEATGSATLANLTFDVNPSAKSLEIGMMITEYALYDIDGRFISGRAIGGPPVLDLNSDGVTNSIDIQMVINSVLGVPPVCIADPDSNGVDNSIDIQLIINEALGLSFGSNYDIAGIGLDG